jgi:hypothetical protein
LALPQLAAANLAVGYLDSLLPSRERPRPAFRLADLAPLRILRFAFRTFDLRAGLRFAFGMD